jgi:GMP synthase (glutamine-hydrolysing)
MKIKEIPLKKLKAGKFISKQVEKISKIVGEGQAINALSGGVDSSVVTLLGHRALGKKLKTFIIENGLMREGEVKSIVAIFAKLGVKVTIVKAENYFFEALKGITDPEEKREAISQVFYKKVFRSLVLETGAKYLLQGTNLTDIEETVAGIKRQHNVFAQLGIDPKKNFGYRIIEPLIQLRKDGIRQIAAELGLPTVITKRIPFPGPALATRVIGEVTPDKVAIVRKATAIVEAELAYTLAFQYLAVLHEDRVTGIRGGQRQFGHQIEIRCWDSSDARIAEPTNIYMHNLKLLASRITNEIPEVVSVTYNITRKPPSTIEAL